MAFQVVQEFYTLYTGGFVDRYSCENKTELEWFQTGMKRPITGLYLLISGTLFEAAYFVILYAMKTPELMKNNSLRIMFIIGCYDAISLLENAFYPGYQCIVGGVFCTHPLSSLFMGNFALTMWFAASTTCAYLALGRYGDITGNRYIAVLFENKNRVTMGLVFILIYAIVGVGMTDTMMFNTVYMAYLFNPMNGKAETYEYYNPVQIFQNIFVFFTITTLHIMIVLRIRRDVQTWQQNSSFQRSVTIQSLLTSSLYDLSAMAYTYINYFVVPDWVIVVCHLGYQLSSGVPCFIYICMNKTIRKNIIKMISGDAAKTSKVSVSALQ